MYKSDTAGVRKYLYRILFILISIFYLNACIDGHPFWEFEGGGIGNIKIYSLTKNKEILINCFNKLYENKKIFKLENSIYKDDDLSTVACFIQEKDTFAFGYEISSDQTDSLKGMIILIHFAKNGEVLELEHDLTRSQMHILIDFFDRDVIPFIIGCDS